MQLPPGQQQTDKWPSIGEREPAARSDPWRIEVIGCVDRPLSMSLDELKQFPRREAVIDIHCVTRWSKLGVPVVGTLLADLLDVARATEAARFASFIARSERRHSTSLPLAEALSLGTMIVWEAEGVPLDSGRGGPVRTIVPGKYFYKSLKWLETIELLAEDRLGHWEGAAGYHNGADPWREERYIAASLDRAEIRRLLATRDFRDREMLSMAAAGLSLEGLDASRAILRDADFRGAKLSGARFDGANLTNAHFDGADLRGASFVGAGVEGASFCRANLAGADFHGASLVAAQFCGELDGVLMPEQACTIDAATRFDRQSIPQLTSLQAAFLNESIKKFES